MIEGTDPQQFLRSAVMVVFSHKHPTFYSAVLAMLAGVSLVPTTPDAVADGSRAYGFSLPDGDHARIGIDADGSINLAVFDRANRRYVADLTLDSVGLSGQLGSQKIEEPLLCAGVDLGGILAALRDATIEGGAVRFEFAGRRLAAA